MGQEIVYCYKCQRRIIGAEFAKGQAFQVGIQASCATCAVDLLQTLGSGDREQLIAKMFKATQERQGPAAPPPAPTARRKGSTVKNPVVTVAPETPSSSWIPIAAVVGVVLVGAIVVVALSGGEPRKPDPPPAPVANRPPPQPPAAPPLDPAIRKAREFAAKNPKDLQGQIEAWAEATRGAEGTPFLSEARREHRTLLDRRNTAIAAELLDLEGRIRGPLAAKEYKSASDLFQGARGRYDVPEWTAAIDRRVAEIQRLAPVKEPAIQAPAPAVPAESGKVILSETFAKGRGIFGGTNGEIVDAGPGGVRAIAIPPKGAGIINFSVVLKPTTTMRFRVKASMDLDVFEVMAYVGAKKGNAWYHVANLKKDEWKQVEFKAGEMRFNYNSGPAAMGETMESLRFYFANRPEDSRVLLTDFELRD